MKSWEAAIAVIQFFILGEPITLCIPEDHENFMQVWQAHVTCISDGPGSQMNLSQTSSILHLWSALYV